MPALSDEQISALETRGSYSKVDELRNAVRVRNPPKELHLRSTRKEALKDFLRQKYNTPKWQEKSARAAQQQLPTPGAAQPAPRLKRQKM
jgi:hypothetical protein